MFKSVYETTSGSAFFNKDLVKRLNLARAEGTLVKEVVKGVYDLLALVDTGPRSKDIPAFEHPVQINEPGRPTYWVIDLRPYASKIKANKDVIPEEGNINLLVKRTLLEMYWNKFGSKQLAHAGDLPLVVYARWISGLIGIRCHLDEGSKQKVMILSAYFYLCQHTPTEDMTPKTEEAFALKIARSFRLQPNEVLSFLKDVPYIGTLSQFCTALQTHVYDKSLGVVDTRFLITITMTSWFGGADARSLVAAALEFPPVFIALVLAGGKEKLYRKTIISEIVQRENRTFNFAQYSLIVNNILRELQD